MDRRTFIGTLGGGLLAAPLAAGAQQRVGTRPRVGYLLPTSRRSSNREFMVGLHNLGYQEGKDLLIERRYAEGRPERYPALALDLVRLPVDVIVADGSAATRAAKDATTSIPIVMIAADPVSSGFIASLNRPSGNVTGLSTDSPELIGKRMQLLKQAFPRAAVLALLFNPLNPATESFLKECESAAGALGLQTTRTPVGAADQMRAAFAAILSSRADTLLLIEDPSVISQAARRISEFAIEHRLLTLAGLREYAESGVLISYGPGLVDLFRRTAFYVDKILRGLSPEDMPVEQPTKFELVVNLKTAKALGLTIPPSLLQRADQVIE
jgi:ABC-type uncharacterized transport system substrate-binding protein